MIIYIYIYIYALCVAGPLSLDRLSDAGGLGFESQTGRVTGYGLFAVPASATAASPAPTRLRYLITSLPHNSSLLDGRVNNKKPTSSPWRDKHPAIKGLRPPEHRAGEFRPEHRKTLSQTASKYTCICIIYVDVYVYMYIYIYTHICYIYIYIYIHTCVYIHMHAIVCVCVCVRVCMYVCMYVCNVM